MPGLSAPCQAAHSTILLHVHVYFREAYGEEAVPGVLLAAEGLAGCAGELCSAAATLGMLRFFLLSHQEDFDVVWCRGALLS